MPKQYLTVTMTAASLVLLCCASHDPRQIGKTNLSKIEHLGCIDAWMQRGSGARMISVVTVAVQGAAVIAATAVVTFVVLVIFDEVVVP